MEERTSKQAVRGTLIGIEYVDSINGVGDSIIYFLSDRFKRKQPLIPVNLKEEAAEKLMFDISKEIKSEQTSSNNKDDILDGLG